MRVLVFLLLLVIGPLIAGGYGAAHDQVSYTVSKEYFTKFKFVQFRLRQNPLPDRVKASIVGFLATWWMGVPISLVVGLFGFRHSPAKGMLRRSLQAYAVVMLVTVLVGLGGLIYGWFFVSHEVVDYPGWGLPANLQDVRGYIAVGYMHNFGYLGGVIGLLAGVAYQLLSPRLRHVA